MFPYHSDCQAKRQRVHSPVHYIPCDLHDGMCVALEALLQTIYGIAFKWEVHDTRIDWCESMLTRYLSSPPPPCPAPPPLVQTPPLSTVTWPMNNKKLLGNHRRRRKILVGYTRIQVIVVWCPPPPLPPGGGGGTVVPGGGVDMGRGTIEWCFFSFLL